MRSIFKPRSHSSLTGYSFVTSRMPSTTSRTWSASSEARICCVSSMRRSLRKMASPAKAEVPGAGGTTALPLPRRRSSSRSMASAATSRRNSGVPTGGFWKKSPQKMKATPPMNRPGRRSRRATTSAVLPSSSASAWLASSNTSQEML